MVQARKPERSKEGPFEGHLSYRPEGFDVPPGIPRQVQRLRRWFRVYCDEEIVEFMMA
jgi:hypothetical protein